MILPSTVRSGDAEALLRAASRDAEAGDDLVEDEECAALAGEAAKGLEEPVGGRDDAHVSGDRLDDDGGDVVAVAFEDIRDGVRVVIAE